MAKLVLSSQWKKMIKMIDIDNLSSFCIIYKTGRIRRLEDETELREFLKIMIPGTANKIFAVVAGSKRREQDLRESLGLTADGHEKI
jgi:hypothetical protein